MKRWIVGLIASVMTVAFFTQLLWAEPPVKKSFGGNNLYSSGVMVGKTFYVAGSGSVFKGGQPKTFPDQARQCWKNIGETLKMAGLGMENVVQCWIMLDNLDNYQAMDNVFGELFPVNPPARTTLGMAAIPGDNHIEITVIAYSDLSERKCITKKESGNKFSQGVIAGNTLYISGDAMQIKGKMKPFKGQVKQSIDTVGNILKEAGLDFSNVVWSNVYLDNYSNLGAFNKIYGKFFDRGSEPARANVFVNNFPGNMNVKFACIATLDKAGRKIIRDAGMKCGPKELYDASSPAVWAGDMLYISTQYGSTPGKKTGLEEQIDQVMKSHQDILEKAGLEFKDIVSVNVFLRTINDYKPLNAVYPNYFPAGRPGVRTCFQPFGGNEPNDVLVKMYFFAAKTKSE
ncbi:MAG: RidA family protein [Candidatus Latescibacterota bacterium]